MKVKRFVLLFFVAVCFSMFVGGVGATSTYHSPISIGDTSKHVGPDLYDASGVIWYAPGEKWFLLLQTRFDVFYGNGTYLGSTNSFSCSATSGDHEGVTTINQTSDVIIVQTENPDY